MPKLSPGIEDEILECSPCKNGKGLVLPRKNIVRPSINRLDRGYTVPRNGSDYGLGSSIVVFSNEGYTNYPNRNYVYQRCSGSGGPPLLIFTASQGTTIIQVGSNCYQFFGLAQYPPTNPVPIVAATYANCATCLNPVVECISCPSMADWLLLPLTYTVIVSGNSKTWSCAFPPASGNWNGTYTVTKLVDTYVYQDPVNCEQVVLACSQFTLTGWGVVLDDGTDTYALDIVEPPFGLEPNCPPPVGQWAIPGGLGGGTLELQTP